MPWPTTRTLARAPSDARSSTQTAPVLVASTATTLSVAPTAGFVDRRRDRDRDRQGRERVASEIVDCAAAGPASASAAATAIALRRSATAKGMRRTMGERGSSKG